MQSFEILEKRQDYFLARKGQYHCKIVVDTFSQDLPLGPINLHVEEVSDRYNHYSHEAIFKLIMPLNEQGCVDIYTMPSGRHNQFVYQQCLRLGGQWQNALNEWVFAAAISHKVDALRQIIESEPLYIEATLKESVTVVNEPFSLFGFPIIRQINGDKVITQHGVKMTSGDAAIMGDERSNKTIVLAGSKFRLFVPKAMIEDTRFHEDFLCIVDITKKRKPRTPKRPLW